MGSRRTFLRGALACAAAGVGIRAPRAADGPAKRVFVAGFAHETNTFHPVETTSFAIRRTPPLALPVWKGSEIVEVPGVSAYPEGGGTIEEAPCREAMAKVIASLRSAMPVDGVFFRLHGAMYAEGIGAAEAALVAEARGIVGPEIPIACTFDLHGNIPARLARYGDILVGLKTAPHTDQAETAALAGRILLETLRGRVRPVSYILPIPIIVQGEKAMTTAEPFRSLVEEARRIERDGIPGHAARILAATLFVGCAWTDSPDTGMAAAVTADGSREAARAAAIHLARRIWDARRRFSFGCETADLQEGVGRALAAEESTIFLTDSGDNVTASAPGDLSIVLRHLVERKARDALVAGIRDASATERCIAAGEGKAVRLSIGASIEKRFGPPFEAEAEVVRIARMGDEPMAVIRIGAVEAILVRGPAAFTDLSRFRACGIDPLRRKIVVVKQGYLYPALARIAPRHIMLLTPGAGDMRIERLAYARRRRPAFPFEDDAAFDPEAAPPIERP